jgi:large subunit ribosomal protein L25
VEEFTLQIQSRSEVGSSVARRLRKTGIIPAIVYHRGEESIPASLNQKEFLQLASKAKFTQIFHLKSDDSRLNNRSVLVKEVMKNFQTDTVLHVDFQALKDDEMVQVAVSIRLIGDAPGVKVDGGILSFISHELLVMCLPKAIPSELVVDVSHLHIGQSIHAGDVKLPTGVNLAAEPEETIVTVVSSRASRMTDGAGEAETTPAGTPAPVAKTPQKK